jgi:CspA family cold shock protein
MNEGKIEQGTVTVFDAFKGFGFIRRKSGKDVFVFYLDILEEDQTLVEGDVVKFLVRSTGKGPKAEQVKKVY